MGKKIAEGYTAPSTRMGLKKGKKLKDPKRVVEKKTEEGNITPNTRVEFKKEKKLNAYKGFWYKLIAFSFFAAIYGMLVLRITLPVPTMSMAENRELKKMPPLNFQNIFFGKFTTDFEDYFADTFPLRDTFMNAGEYVSYLYKLPISGVDSIVTADDNMMQGEDSADEDQGEPQGGPAGGDQTSEDDPSPTETIVKNPLTGETPTPTPQPTPEPQEQKGTYLLTDTAIYKETIRDAQTYTAWAQGINKLAREFPDKKIMAMSPPTSFLFYADPKYFKQENDQKAGIADLYAQLDESVIPIDPIPFLEQHKSEYIYFRTDQHWTARGAYCGYLAFCEKTGITPLSLDEFQPNTFYHDFLGSHYRVLKDTAKAKIIKGSPDYIEYFVPPVECNVTIYDNASSMEGGRKGQLFDLNVKESPTYYYMFLGDDYPCVKITTDTNNGRSLMVFKDSYADAFAPFLTAHYQTIYVVDYRDYNSTKKPKFKAADFVKKNNVDEVLFILHFDFVNVQKRVQWYLKALPD